MISDAPIASYNDDLFERAFFVNMIKTSILRHKEVPGYTIGICGQWGSGKTSIINLLKNDLQSTDVEIMEFNPWVFSDQTDLIKQYFIDLIDTYDSIKEKDRSKILTPFHKIKKKITVGPQNRFKVGKVKRFLSIFKNSDSSKLFNLIYNYVERLNNPYGDTSTVELKNEISSILKNNQKHILVIIDDIDRLDSDEIKIVFKLIRAVADFENVTYLLAYDSEIVERSLSCEQYEGSDYVRKIINESYHIPNSDEELIRYSISKYYSDVTGEIISPNIEKTVSLFSKSARDTKRLFIMFETTVLTRVRENLDSEELLLLTIINMKDPKLYEWLSYHKDSVLIYTDNENTFGRDVIITEYEKTASTKVDPICNTAIQLLFYDHKNVQNTLSIKRTQYYDDYFDNRIIFDESKKYWISLIKSSNKYDFLKYLDSTSIDDNRKFFKIALDNVQLIRSNAMPFINVLLMKMYENKELIDFTSINLYKILAKEIITAQYGNIVSNDIDIRILRIKMIYHCFYPTSCNTITPFVKMLEEESSDDDINMAIRIMVLEKYLINNHISINSDYWDYLTSIPDKYSRGSIYKIMIVKGSISNHFIMTHEHNYIMSAINYYEDNKKSHDDHLFDSVLNMLDNKIKFSSDSILTSGTDSISH